MTGRRPAPFRPTSKAVTRSFISSLGPPRPNVPESRGSWGPLCGALQASRGAASRACVTEATTHAATHVFVRPASISGRARPIITARRSARYGRSPRGYARPQRPAPNETQLDDASRSEARHGGAASRAAKRKVALRVALRTPLVTAPPQAITALFLPSTTRGVLATRRPQRRPAVLRHHPLRPTHQGQGAWPDSATAFTCDERTHKRPIEKDKRVLPARCQFANP